ncbi:MAG: 3D domain-containing protein [Armatimonadota bacterium]|jgi:3D (Asp-Asp-Asp) domain-containing protein
MKVSHTSGTGACRVLLAAVTCALLVSLAAPAFAGTSALAAKHSWLPWPSVWPADHPLAPVVERVLKNNWRAQPEWKLPMLVNGLNKEPENCKITAYCSQCFDAGSRTRWGSPVRRGIAAADPKYWGPGSVVWIGPPVNEVVVIEDTGGAIKGPHRFDVCMEGSHDMCYEIGVRTTTYVPLHRVPPTSRWGTKPADWEPPVWACPPDEYASSR